MIQIIIFSFSLFIFCFHYFSQSMEFSVIEEKEIQKIPDVLNYVTKFQSNDYKGYKLFNRSENDKIVVISS